MSKTPIHRKRPAELLAAGVGIPAAIVTALLAHLWFAAAVQLVVALIPAFVTGWREHGGLRGLALWVWRRGQ